MDLTARRDTVHAHFGRGARAGDDRGLEASELGRHLEAVEHVPPFELDRGGGGDTGDPVEPVAAGDLDEPGRDRRAGLDAATTDRVVVAVEVLPDVRRQLWVVGVDPGRRVGAKAGLAGIGPDQQRATRADGLVSRCPHARQDDDVVAAGTIEDDHRILAGNFDAVLGDGLAHAVS